MKKLHVVKMNITKMRMFSWMCGKTRKDWIRNKILDILKIK